MESISIFEIIKIGIGPSSSHTMGPWKAAEMFLQYITKRNKSIQQIIEVEIHLYGSLAKTGKGHGTDIAVLMGLSAYDYTQIDTSIIPSIIDKIKIEKKLMLGASHTIDFDYDKHLVFHMKESLDFHPNGMVFKAHFKDQSSLEHNYYSVGGGFVTTDGVNTIIKNAITTPYPCHQAESLVSNCKKLGISISDLIYKNEEAWRSNEQIKKEALNIWREIKECIYRGTHKEGILPGGLNVKRRAGELNTLLLNGYTYNSLEEWIACIKKSEHSFNKVNKWISCFALAVNEENASFGRIITAPTNGSAGVIPAVMMYAHCFTENFDDEKAIRFLLTAGEIGTIFKKNATISAAMGGCQAEIGVSSAMAAGALTECTGASPEQVLMAAEIAMEHHLGLTCDPIGGLVQIPCIERNSMGAIKAITASNLAQEGDPAAALVSLDDVIKSMWETAKDMNMKYKETSEGGLATNISVNVAEC